MKTSLPSLSVTAWLMRPSLKKKSLAEPLLVNTLHHSGLAVDDQVLPVAGQRDAAVERAEIVDEVPWTAEAEGAAYRAAGADDYRIQFGAVIVRPALNVPWLSTKFRAL